MNDKRTLKIVDYINNGPPVRQTFVHHAIGVYAHFMLQDENAVRKAMKNGHIDPEDWIKAAKDYKAEVENLNQN